MVRNDVQREVYGAVMVILLGGRMALSQDGQKTTRNEMMADIFFKIIQKRRGGKNVTTEEDKNPKRDKKEGKIQISNVSLRV